MAPSWDTRRFPEREVRFHALPDVFVVGEGLLFDRALELVEPSRTQHSPAEVAAERTRLQAALAGGVVPEDRGTTLLCQKRGMANYGHWLIELLPIAHLALPWLRDRLWTVLVPHLAGGMGAVVADSLAAIGVPARAVRLGDGAPRHLEEAILAEGLTSHGYVVSPPVMDCMDAVMAGVAADAPAPVWVSRDGRDRCLWNEAEVERVLAALGWRVLRPESMPLRAQVAAFRGARAVAGVHGAGLTGLVFAPPGTPVTSFIPAAMPDTFFWLLSALRGHRYREVRAPHDWAPQGKPAYDAALVLSLAQVLAELA